MTRRAARRIGVIAALVAAAALAAGVVGGTRVYRAASDSMSPAIAVGDVVVATATDGRDLERGDIVVFADPGDWAERTARLSGAEEVAAVFVKRVVGLPGERVACCDASGELTVDGVRVDGAGLTGHQSSDAGGLASLLAFDITVPEDAVFVLGDKRSASVDSRYLGGVPLQAVLAVERFVLPLH